MAVTAQQLWDAIKRIESGGDYKAHSKSSSASGVGQWIRSTWNGYGGFAEAWQAPPEVQERRGIEDATAKLKAYAGDARRAAMSWFLPSAVNNPRIASMVPRGNSISPNQYADKVLKALGMPALKAATGAVAGDAEVSYDEHVDRPAQYGTIEGQLANLMTAISSPTDRAF